MITIVDYGLSNLLSIERAVKLYTNEYIVTGNPEAIKIADKIILPGVGAIEYGMNKIKQLGLYDELITAANRGVPILGICLGMQMLFDYSDENGGVDCLKLIPGRVVKFDNIDTEGNRLNVPHIGWEPLNIKKENLSNNSILKDVFPDEELYFVHSYFGVTENENNLIATISYGGKEVCAVVQKNNVIGCQFHPEKSGETGLKIVRNFVKDFE